MVRKVITWIQWFNIIIVGFSSTKYIEALFYTCLFYVFLLYITS